MLLLLKYLVSTTANDRNVPTNTEPKRRTRRTIFIWRRCHLVSLTWTQWSLSKATMLITPSWTSKNGDTCLYASSEIGVPAITHNRDQDDQKEEIDQRQASALETNQPDKTRTDIFQKRKHTNNRKWEFVVSYRRTPYHTSTSIYSSTKYYYYARNRFSHSILSAASYQARPTRMLHTRLCWWWKFSSRPCSHGRSQTQREGSSPGGPRRRDTA